LVSPVIEMTHSARSLASTVFRRLIAYHLRVVPQRHNGLTRDLIHAFNRFRIHMSHHGALAVAPMCSSGANATSASRQAFIV
jgi:hypothetical protein